MSQSQEQLSRVPAGAVEMEGGFEEDFGDGERRVFRFTLSDDLREVVLRKYINASEGDDDYDAPVCHRIFRMDKNNAREVLDDLTNLQGVCDDIEGGVFDEYICPMGNNKYIFSEEGTGVVNARTYLGGMDKMIKTTHGVQIQANEFKRVLYLLQEAYPLMKEPISRERRLNPVERRRLSQELERKGLSPTKRAASGGSPSKKSRM